MTYHILTLFPNMFDSYFGESIISSAIENKIIAVNTYNLRDYTQDKHRRVDGRPYGGGPGMIMWIDPIVNCVEDIKNKIEKKYVKDSKKNKVKKTKILFVHFGPSEEKFTTGIAKNISQKYTDIIFICGRYEGVDSRVSEIYKGINISVGDYVLTGGELPAMIMIDSISRQVKGVLNKIESLEENRVSSSKIYARPEIYEYKTKLNLKIKTKTSKKSTIKGDLNQENLTTETKAVKIEKKEIKTNLDKIRIKKYAVPKVLLSGNHKEIDKWREENR